MIGDFVAAVRDGRDPIASGEQGRHILDATLDLAPWSRIVRRRIFGVS